MCTRHPIRDCQSGAPVSLNALLKRPQTSVSRNGRCIMAERENSDSAAINRTITSRAPASSPSSNRLVASPPPDCARDELTSEGKARLKVLERENQGTAPSQ